MLLNITLGDIGTYIQNQSISEQLKILEDYYGFKNIERHSSIMNSDDLENTYYVTNNDGKEGVFIKDIGLIEGLNGSIYLILL